MKITTEGYLFESSGRLFKSHGTAHIGIYNPVGNKFDIGQGYDHSFIFYDEEGESDYDFKQSEKQELADYMIALWTKFRDS